MVVWPFQPPMVLPTPGKAPKPKAVSPPRQQQAVLQLALSLSDRTTNLSTISTVCRRSDS